MLVAAAILCAAPLLAGCGQKGPLYLPGRSRDTPWPPPPAPVPDHPPSSRPAGGG